jgi:hypothetical protein
MIVVIMTFIMLFFELIDGRVVNMFLIFCWCRKFCFQAVPGSQPAYFPAVSPRVNREYREGNPLSFILYRKVKRVWMYVYTPQYLDSVAALN